MLIGTSERKCQVLSGLFGPHTSGSMQTFPIHQTTPPTLDSVYAGHIVTLVDDGTGEPTVALATTPNITAAMPSKVYFMLDGAESTDVQACGKAAAVNGKIYVVTDKFTAAAFAINDTLSFNAGLLIQSLFAAGTQQKIGHVVKYDSTNGLLYAILDL